MVHKGTNDPGVGEWPSTAQLTHGDTPWLSTFTVKDAMESLFASRLRSEHRPHFSAGCVLHSYFIFLVVALHREDFHNCAAASS